MFSTHQATLRLLKASEYIPTICGVWFVSRQDNPGVPLV